MGLDMFLYARRSFYETWDKESDDSKKSVAIKNMFPELMLLDECNIHSIQLEFGRWRKANAIHKWFVENVQDGEDNCQDHFVSESNIRDLLEVITKVLDNPSKAEKLLPTQSGFFFGNTSYNDMYFQDLKYTKEILERALEPDMLKNWHFYYRASW